MQRKDIEIGVEYAATAPLAYGREPSTPARKVRVTDTRPGPWWRVVTTRYAKGASAIRDGYGWETTGVELVHSGTGRGRELTASLPNSFYRARPDDPKPGDEVTYLDTTVKGGLPGEFWSDRRQEWVATLVVPAEIHRTWAEIEAQAQARREREAGYDRAARLPELRELLNVIGLGDTLTVSRSGSGSKRVAIESRGKDGDTLLAELTTWAQAKGLIAKIEV